MRKSVLLKTKMSTVCAAVFFLFFLLLEDPSFFFTTIIYMCVCVRVLSEQLLRCRNRMRNSSATVFCVVAFDLKELYLQSIIHVHNS